MPHFMLEPRSKKAFFLHFAAFFSKFSNRIFSFKLWLIPFESPSTADHFKYMTFQFSSTDSLAFPVPFLVKRIENVFAANWLTSAF